MTAWKNENAAKSSREFGVPIAGEILEPAQWTQQLLKRLPEQGRLAGHNYSDARPVVLDLGCGNGRFLLQAPSGDWTTIMSASTICPRHWAMPRGGKPARFENLRFAVARAEFLALVEPGSVAEIHCYHPQPYYDPREVRYANAFPHDRSSWR